AMPALFAEGTHGSHGLQCLPLIQTQYLADRQQHLRVDFFKVHASLGDGLELGINLSVIELVGVDQRLQRLLTLIDSATSKLEVFPILLKDALDLLRLRIRQTDLLHDL